ncbi:MAG: bifunctional adenosylcobinamide kinase/adenosylcobinamide-phosphate guanylyltransferase [Eubacteriales bacterium]|nr:bifunctional adenosylcobinamide kinase/adenosylcobinamide-phosphate guanylyltransferase [Eubacteriales bacterium]
MTGLRFVIGGAYQGKLGFVLAQQNLQATQVFTCGLDTLEIDWSLPVIDKLHLLFWAQQQKGIDSQKYLESHREKLLDHWLICDDLSAGVVPIDAKTRMWRETTGRCSVYLATQADEVYRIFCGLATTLKP